MAQIEIFEQKDFTGGLNLRSDQFQLANNESPEMLNVEVDPRGGVFSRGGMARINPTWSHGTWAPKNVYPFYRGNASSLMLSNNKNVYHSSGGDFTRLDASSGVPVYAGGDYGPSFVSWGNDLYITNAHTSVGAALGAYKWDGSATYPTMQTPSGSAPNAWQGRTTSAAVNKFPHCNIATVHTNKMFVANTLENGIACPNRVRWSDEDLVTNWVENDYIDILSGGPEITAMASVNGVLLVFKKYAVYAILGYDYTDFRVVPLSENIGASSQNAIAISESGVYFYSDDKGLFFTNGNSVQDIFSPLRPLFDLKYLDATILDYVNVSWIGRRVWLSVPYTETGAALTKQTVLFVFDPSQNSYTKFATADNYGFASGCDWRKSNGREVRIGVHANTAAVLEVDRYSDYYDSINVNGSISGFESTYRTKWFDAGSFLQRKMFRRPDLVMRESSTNQLLNVKVFHDYQEAAGSEKREFSLSQTSTVDGLVWGGNWAIEPAGGTPYGSYWSPETLGGSIVQASNLGLCKTVQLKFTGELLKPWGINSVGYKWSPRRVKG